MKRAAPLAIVFAAVLALCCRPSAGAVPAPAFILQDLSGKVVRLQDFRGKVVLLNVWATWCPPCVEEMPTLELLWQRLSHRDFVLLAVSQDEATKKVKPWIEQRKFTFPVLLDPRGMVANGYGVSGFPETFVVDRQGRIVHHHVGFRDWAEPEIVEAIEALLSTGEWRAPEVEAEPAGARQARAG